MEIDEIYTEMTATSLGINSSTDVLQQIYYDCKLFSTTF